MSSWEASLYKYNEAFDRSLKKDFSDLEELFDDLYHEDYELITTDGRTVSREAIKDLHHAHYSMGYKLATYHFKRISSDNVDVLFRVEDREGLGEKIIHINYTIVDNKVAKGQVVDDCVSRVTKHRRLSRHASRTFGVYNALNKYNWYLSDDDDMVAY